MKKLALSTKGTISFLLSLFIAIFTLSYYSVAAPTPQEELLKSQIKLFQEALDNLKISTPQEAAELWAKGENTRNGVLQYMASCPKLREKLINTWGSPENNLWVIGVSSPWVTSYEISKPIPLNKDSCEILITYRMSSSSGEEKPVKTLLKLSRFRGQWCVTEAVTKEE